MQIHVRLSTTLRRYVAGYDPEQGMWMDLAPGEQASALDLARRLGLPDKEIKFIILNGRNQPILTILKDNDRLAYFPAVGGG